MVRVAPSRDVQKPNDLAALSPLLMNIAQLSSNVRCRLGNGAPLNGQPNIKKQKLDESANSTVAGMSASTAIPIDDIANSDEDDDGIEILEDEDDSNANAAIVMVDAQGNATTSTRCAVNTTGSSTFAPFMLMDLHPDVVADIKGKNRKIILNQLRKQYYNSDMTWVKCLHLQLPQEPHSNRNTGDVMEHMLQEQKSNKYIQQCIFSVACIWTGAEGKFSAQFCNIMERVHSREKFRLARGRHKRGV